MQNDCDSKVYSGVADHVALANCRLTASLCILLPASGSHYSTLVLADNTITEETKIFPRDGE